MKKISLGHLFLFIVSFFASIAYSQTPTTNTSADIYLQLKKLNVLGSVLYIAAHPDDENNTLLPYLAKERLYRTAYLSLTRGDGGQNLIGSEQGIELGLIRTQELLAARKIDDAEQFFTRAYEFGFSKSSEEALRIWDHNKVLSDVVWVIRQYQPDVIIRRFPTDARAGHGHHSASGMLAQEAFAAAADPTRFPEQFKYGVRPWQAKRILWNGFNFGGVNTTSEDQLKIDVGVYNPLHGKSYGELGGEARSMHKSQGTGSQRRKGAITEYFTTTGGDSAKTDLMDGVIHDWSRLPGGDKIQPMIRDIINNYKFAQPELSVPALVKLYQAINALPESNWRHRKLEETQKVIEACAALFIEATSNQQSVVQGDVLNTTFFFNKRSHANVTLKGLKLRSFDSSFSAVLTNNQNISVNKTFAVAKDEKISQPYWLEHPQTESMFDVRDQTLIGKAENDPSFVATFTASIEGVDFIISRPVQYKVVDPAKGELYQPLVILPRVELGYASENFVSVNGAPVRATAHFRSNIKDSASYKIVQHYSPNWMNDHAEFTYETKNNSEAFASGVFTPKTKSNNITEQVNLSTNNGAYDGFSKVIAYDHIPTITYFSKAKANLVKVDLKTVGKKIGYVSGAGDKVPEALTAMGYNLTFLNEHDITEDNLKQYHAVIIGIRALNVYEYLTDRNEVLNAYVRNGGNLVVQYMKSNQVGAKRIKVGPYPFSISTGSRVTEEDAKVRFLLPSHPALNYPNKISDKDFEGWVQERSTYQVDQSDEHYEKLLAMNDKGEKESNGSLVIAKYGKGNFAYVSLVLFRQLPAGVAGGYRLMANLIALPQNK
jgi:LmbE family N-acetylglucosaminyl deacetylase